MSQDLDQQVRKAMVEFFRQVPRRYPVFSVVIVGLILVLVIWFIPQWQVPVSGLSLKDRLHQINENRKTVAQIVGGVAGGFSATAASAKGRRKRVIKAEDLCRNTKYEPLIFKTTIPTPP